MCCLEKYDWIKENHVDDDKKMMILFSTLLFILLLNTESKRSEAGCQFPPEWEGIWFQSTVRPYITIDATSISSKGQCTKTDFRGEKYLIKVDGERKCYKCIVIYQKHHNVLQYKETKRCSKRNDLHRVCSGIAGDANLYTLFRIQGNPIDCPFGTEHGFKFSYDKGKGECEWPESELEPCTDTKRLMLNYQACPNVQGSELMSEKLECQASWRDGSRHFMVGKLDHPHAANDEDKFRCFVYEYKDVLRPSEGIYLAQSGDATCNGLFSPHEGSRTLKLKKAPSKIGCTFPRWMQKEKSWATIDGALIWKFATSGNSTWMNMTTVTSNNFGGISSYVKHEESLVWCHKIITDITSSSQDSSQTAITATEKGEKYQTRAKIILYQTQGCSSGFVCSDIRQLTQQGVLRVKLGSLTRTKEYACDESQFRGHSDYLLLSSGVGSVDTSSAQIDGTSKDIPNGLFHINGDPSSLIGQSRHHGQQMSAAVRADFHENSLSSGNQGKQSSNNKLCQDGATSKVISVILGCASKTHSDLEIRSSCLEDVDFPKEYENSHIWSQNGTDFRVYKPLRKTQETTGGICLAFQNSADSTTAETSSSSSQTAIGSKKLEETSIVKVQKLDKNCRQQVSTISPDTTEPNASPVRLVFQGECSVVTSKSSYSATRVFGFQQEDKVFMILLNLSLFHFAFF